MKFKAFLEKASIYRHEKTNKWTFEPEVKSYVDKMGHTIIAIGLLEKFFKSRKDNPFIFTYLSKNEKGKSDDFKATNKNKDELLCRYASRNTIAGGMMPLCIINPAKGYMRFMENIDEDPELEDAQWSKPEKFDHLRTIL